MHKNFMIILRVLVVSVLAFLTFKIVSASELGYGLDLSSNVSVASDYVWRGDTQTDGGPAISGGLDLTHSSGLYVGNWNSNVDGGIEMDVYGGLSRNIGILNYDLGVIGYLYPKQDGLDFYEFYAGLALKNDMATPSVKVSCDPDNENRYAEGSLDLALGAATLTSRIGYNAPEHGKNLYDWGLGVGLSALTLDWNVNYTDKENGKQAVFVSVGKSF